MFGSHASFDSSNLWSPNIFQYDAVFPSLISLDEKSAAPETLVIESTLDFMVSVVTSHIDG